MPTARVCVLTCAVAFAGFLAGCTNPPAVTVIERGTPWNAVRPAAKKLNYVIGDTTGLATSRTLFGEPPGITLDLNNDRLLIIGPDEKVESVGAIVILGNVSRPKAYQTWESVKSFDLVTGAYAKQ